MLTTATRLDAMTRIGRAISDPTRARIVLALLDDPRHPAELADQLELTRANVSNHLSCLRGCGIVVTIPEGRQVRYEIADPHLTRALLEMLDVVLAVGSGEGCTDPGCDVPACCAPEARR